MSTHLKSTEIVGKKEDVSDIITMLDPSETPFIRSIGSESIHNTLYQWQEDALQPVGLNAKIEGATAVNDNFDQPDMKTNGTQILSKVYEISETSGAIKAYGRAKEEARVKLIATKSVMRDLEHSAVGTGQTYVVGNAATAPQFAGVQAQIGAATKADAAGSAITKALVDEVSGKIYDAGAEAKILMVKPSDAQVVSGFASNERVINDSNKTYVDVVEVYINAYGTLKVVKNRRLRATDALFYSPENFKLMVLRDWKTKDLAKTGDSDRAMIVGEFGLKHKHVNASGLIENLA